ncbi:MAG TPA: CCA tRNA nucleotidyltransferase [Candidatus Dormibacteraeota bacterium]|nr:CCA tRNA nucleotidyltransferase [Candidatus Dormibacteraeota bacterium]
MGERGFLGQRSIMSKDFAISIVKTLRQQGFQAYFAGGCVRDLVLKREPADYDVATSATPAQVMEVFPDTYAVGAQFGVVLVPLPQELRAGGTENATSKAQAVEVATFRSDLGYSDGRRPDEVRFSQDPREDVARRDFTINGMMLDPVSGEVVDFVGGCRDLESGIVRAIGDPGRRFAEDKLRMLRAVRFAARFEYEIEAKTLSEIQRQAHEIQVVSRERVRDELTRMLTEGRARRAFLLLDETGLLKEVLPEITAMKGVEQPPEFHPEGDVFIHTLLLLENLPAPCPPTLAWGALLHDVGKPATFRVAPDRIRFDDHVNVGVKIAEEVCGRLRLSNDDAKQILALVDNHMRFSHATRMNQSTLKKFLRMPGFDEHLALNRADSLASHRNLSTYEFIRQKLAEIPPEKIRPVPLVTGDDLIAAGYEPGPRFREILEAVEDLQLEGRLSSHDAALEFVKREFPL